MSFYQDEFLRIKQAHFSKEYLYKQAMQAKQFMEQQYLQPINLDHMA